MVTDSPGWALLRPLEHPAGEGQWERLKRSQGARLCLPWGGVITLQGVSPEAEHSPPPRTRRDRPQSCAPDFRAVLQNAGEPPAPPWTSPSTTTGQPQHHHDPGTHRLP